MQIPIVIQNVDHAISARDFPELGVLYVTSIFRTIQGEGPFAGRPAVFLRLAGCNYGDKKDHCQFCDTSFQLDKATKYTFDEVVNEIQKTGSVKSDVLVITGGEPTLQLNLHEFLPIVTRDFRHIQIETNGTQPKFFNYLCSLTKPHFVISPKANYRTKKYPKIHPDVMDNADCLKYVLSSDPNDPHHEVPEDVMSYCTAAEIPIYVSPMTVYNKPYEGEVSSIWDSELVNIEATRQNYSYAAEYAMRHNLFVSVQMHTFLGIA